MQATLRLSVAAFLLAVSGVAQAGTICAASIADNVSNSSGCETGSTNNDKLNVGPGNDELQVNLDQMFDWDDWEFLGKPFNDGVFSDADWSGNTFGGKWEIPSGLWDLYAEIMIVIKGGNGNNTQINYVGYLIEFGAEMIEYMTPFANPRNGNRKEISHISVYARGTPNSVPEPGSLVLLGGGLLLLGLRRRMRQQA